MHNLKFKIEGEGFPLLFLHGFLEDSRMWEFLSTSSLNYKKIFIDLPGHGGSSVPIGFPSIAHMAGVMGVKTLLLIGYTSEWRWFNDSDKVWYDSVEIVRMSEQKPLADLLPRVKNLLITEYENKA